MDTDKKRANRSSFFGKKSNILNFINRKIKEFNR